MKIMGRVGAGALLGALTGCVSVGGPSAVPPYGAPAATAALAEACIQELRAVTNNPVDDINVLGSDARDALRDYTLEIGGTGIWSCQIDGTGRPVSVDLLSSDGSALA
ncbi:hypothetical protein [Gymnodinialimonas sp.]